MQKLYTVSEIQKIFQMKRSKAYKLMQSEQFPTIKIGRTRYITEEDLELFIKQNMGREITL